MRRQSELQREIAARKKQENEIKLAEKRGGREPRVTSVQPRDTRGGSPPIPTLRSGEKDGASSSGTSSGGGGDLDMRDGRSSGRGVGGGRSAARTPVGSRTPGEGSEETNDELLNQLSEIRKGLER